MHIHSSSSSSIRAGMFVFKLVFRLCSTQLQHHHPMEFLPFLRFLPSNENTFYTLSDDEDKLTIGWSIFHFSVIFYFSFFFSGVGWWFTLWEKFYVNPKCDGKKKPLLMLSLGSFQTLHCCIVCRYDNTQQKDFLIASYSSTIAICPPSARWYLRCELNAALLGVFCFAFSVAILCILKT